ncbi:hypothetical protein ACFL59_11895, partial [Planctomycetota bacterium]
MNSKRLQVAGVPSVLVFADSVEAAVQRGTILFYHGLGVSKLAHLPELRRLARAGFLAIGLDNVGHGERRYPDYEDRFSPPRSDAAFFEVVRETAAEVPSVLDELVRLGLAQNDRLGVGGISLGGYIAYGAVLADRRLRVATPVIGSPVWNGCSAHSLALLFGGKGIA